MIFNFTLLTSLLFLAACSSENEKAQIAALPKVQLALNWFPEAEHGGFYAAEVHGYYKEHGVEVEILGGGPDAPVIQRVATGAVAFGITNADDVLYARAQQAPVVALMAPYQINPRCIMVHASSGIDDIAKISNITLAMSQRPAFSHYLRWKYPFAKVKIVPYPGNITQFLMDPNFAQQGYVFSEPFVAKTKGGDPQALLVADIGFNPYASVLIASEETIATKAQLVEAVVRASVKGWEKYLADPPATNRHINSLNPEMGLEILAYGAEESNALILDPVAQKNGLGTMTPDRWQGLLNQMVAASLIAKDAVDAQTAFTDRFLP
ncbi:MAG: ABC transporter substrate-binding protein [Candidatus Latescibacterota bacterium]|nr:ABC transporter substrate-binding protein [Candidatus Latescibacterota bacterium]